MTALNLKGRHLVGEEKPEEELMGEGFKPYSFHTASFDTMELIAVGLSTPPVLW
jgi:hypothetical protein